MLLNLCCRQILHLSVVDQFLGLNENFESTCVSTVLGMMSVVCQVLDEVYVLSQLWKRDSLSLASFSWLWLFLLYFMLVFLCFMVSIFFCVVCFFSCLPLCVKWILFLHNQIRMLDVLESIQVDLLLVNWIMLAILDSCVMEGGGAAVAVHFHPSSAWNLINLYCLDCPTPCLSHIVIIICVIICVLCTTLCELLPPL